jgi:hypothetical protein
MMSSEPPSLVSTPQAIRQVVVIPTGDRSSSVKKTKTGYSNELLRISHVRRIFAWTERKEDLTKNASRQQKGRRRDYRTRTTFGGESTFRVGKSFSSPNPTTAPATSSGQHFTSRFLPTTLPPRNQTEATMK